MGQDAARRGQDAPSRRCWSVTDRVGIVINRVNLAKHARYDYGDYGDYYSRYRGYYGQGDSAAAKSDPARPTLKLASKK